MPLPTYHLAQLNIARTRAPLDDPIMAEFVDALDRINALAEASPGFIWRLQSENGNATQMRAFEDDDILINMSVWESLKALKAYVYRSDHAEFLRRRKEWFERLDSPPVVLWWIEEGHIPSILEAKHRLAALSTDGPSARAFTFSNTFPPPSARRRTLPAYR